MSLWSMAFVLLFFAPGMFALAIAAPPARWGIAGPFLVALGWALLFAAILIPEIRQSETETSPIAYAALAVVFGGYLFGSAGWLVRWRGRQVEDREYLIQVMHAYVGSLLGAATGAILGLLLMAIAVKAFGITA